LRKSGIDGSRDILGAPRIRLFAVILNGTKLPDRFSISRSLTKEHISLLPFVTDEPVARRIKAL
jgi:hypothetical protein